MTSRLGALGLLAFFSTCARAAEPTLAAFAYAMPVVTTAAAPAYRVAVPVDVYRQCVYEDLRDLRVFNARGEVVPYEIEPPHASPVTKPQEVTLPLYAVTDPTPAGLAALQITLDAHGLADLHARVDGPGHAITGSYLLDTRSLGQPIGAIRVVWPADATEFAGRIRVEAGDSLSSWRGIATGAPVANLHANGAALIEDRIELPPTKASFWRLSWLGAAPAFALKAAMVEPVADTVPVTRQTLTVAGQAVGPGRAEFQFDLGIHAPIDRVRLELPEPNSVIDAQFQARNDREAGWIPVVRGGFYRLSDASGELTSAPLKTPATAQRYWLARLTPAGSTLGGGQLRLTAQWQPAELVFLARGAGPYTLAYGSAAVAKGETSLGALPTPVVPLPASLGAPFVEGGPQRLQASTPGAPWNRTVLWGVLALAVALLGAMAYRLVRDVSDSSAP